MSKPKPHKKLHQIMVRLSDEQLAALDAEVQRLQSTSPSTVTRSDVLRLGVAKLHAGGRR